jgi:Ca-activated chloride channel family protein
MKWGDPHLVVLFLLIPFLILFFRARWRARLAALEKFGNLELVEKLSDSVDRGKQVGKMTLLVVGMVFLILALLRPQFGQKTRPMQRQGQDIIFALDISKSMLAEDFSPNRLEKAKQEIKGFMRLLEGDRVGLVVFAGEAQMVCPLTLDYGAAELFLEEVDTNWLPTPGTNLRDAIEVAAKGFVTEQKEHKNLVLITDGEDHEGDAIEAAEAAEQEGVTIYAIGIGKPEGVPIPVIDERGEKTLKRDKDGEIVTTQLDPETLQRVAANTGGKWHHATGGQLELAEIYSEIKEQEDKEITSSVTTIYEERFQIPLFIALAIFALEPCLSDRRKKRRARRGLPGYEGEVTT